ncbi:hypothetical protein OG730_00010 [Streptomyces sp. NBC_01298]|uniref:hypothetical protein n=1 Tax=Streptomyces sp. NBC_01298 TaxID=2903817 RepID=UPI002E11BA7F|nr:hypothetical protein OG730_00010 [Streptomyces sp. NBC_01298]
MARNGFPEGDFFIVNEASGLCLAAYPGADRVLGREERLGNTTTWTRTDPPEVRLEKRLPSGENVFQGWHYDMSRDSHGRAANLLVNRMDFKPYGRFTLYGMDDMNDAGELEGGVELLSTGRDSFQTWWAKGGRIFTKLDGSTQLLTVVGSVTGTFAPEGMEVKVMEEDAVEEKFQQWKLVEFA